MTAIQIQTTGAKPIELGVAATSAQNLTRQNQTLGVLDVTGLAEDVVRLVAAAPAEVGSVLNAVGELLSTVDLARLITELPHTVGRLGEIAGGLDLGISLPLDGLADLTTRITAALNSGVSDAVDGLAATAELAQGEDLATSPLAARPTPTGVGKAIERTSEVAIGAVSRGTGLLDAPMTTVGERALASRRNAANWTANAQGAQIWLEVRLGEELAIGVERGRGATMERRGEGDQASTLIAQRFVRDQGLDSLLPRSDFSLSARQALENEMAEWVEAGAEVRVTVDLLGGGDRPVQMRVAYEVSRGRDGDVIHDNTVLFRAEGPGAGGVSSSDRLNRLDGQ